jgi:hypothetical protein
LGHQCIRDCAFVCMWTNEDYVEHKEDVVVSTQGQE